MKDPLRQEIGEALLSHMEGEAFERCARALLGTIFPNLARVPGGSDSGYDGAIVEEATDRAPLVSTVSPYKAARENLKRSLTRVRQSGSRADKAFLASPRALTPLQKRALEGIARELGFSALEIFDHEWFVDQLYQDDAWRRELLGIGGRPSALSTVPLRRRVHVPAALVGRGSLLADLRRLSGDAVLWGQPGVGKTFVLEALAAEGWGFFLDDEDPTELANAVRRLQPRRIIIDDVHFQPEALERLLQLREAVGLPFDIVVTTWPARRDEVGQRLGTGQLVEAPLLTQDEIVQVVREIGVQGPRQLVQEIVRQARGRAGLATTLSQLCLAGEGPKVARGDALLTSTVGTYRELLNKESALALAVLSLGGDRGISTSTLQTIVGLPLQEVFDLVRGLAHGGTIEEVTAPDGTSLLTVQPEPLRFAAVADHFFGAPGRLFIWDVVGRLPDPYASLIPIIAAAHRGAQVDHVRLRNMLERGGHERAVLWYAGLGTQEAAYCLETFPTLRKSVAKEILEFAPELGLPVLLADAVGDDRELHSHPDHSLRIIQDYVQGVARPLDHRRAVLAVTKQWAADGGDRTVALAGIASALHPGLHNSWLEPGSGTTFHLQTGTISREALKEVRVLWVEALELPWLPHAKDISPLFHSLEELCYPGRWAQGTPAEWCRAAYRVAREVIPLMAKRFTDHPGVLLHLHRLNRVVDGRVRIAVDPDLRTLYPEERVDGEYSPAAHERQQRRQHAAAKRLARSWLQRRPLDVARRLAFLEREVAVAGLHPWPRLSPVVAESLAAAVSQPERFAAHLMELEAAGDLIMPFLVATVRRRAPRWRVLLKQALARPDTRGGATVIGLTEDVGDKLRTQAIDQCPAWMKNWIQAGRERLDPDVTRGLLRHPDRIVAQAAAVRLGSFRREELIPELRDDWVAAVTEHPAEEFWIRETLSREPDLLERWVEAYISRVGSSERRWERGFDDLGKAMATLSTKQRLRLLASVAEYGNGRVDAEIVAALVGDDEAAVELVLSDLRLEQYREAMVRGEPNEAWLQRALLAVKAGLSPIEVARASLFGGGIVFWTGDESAVYRGQLEAFGRLAPLARTVGEKRIVEAGERVFTDLMTHALERERREAVFGSRY